jgi:hypothetical protein
VRETRRNDVTRPCKKFIYLLKVKEIIFRFLNKHFYYHIGSNLVYILT